MKLKRLFLIVVAALVMLSTNLVAADDGPIFRRNVSKTPDLETGEAALSMMEFYVPAQTSDGTVAPIDYFDAEEQLVETREFAKPLIVTYIDGVETEDHELHEEELAMFSGVGFGSRDAFAALSLDDGATWKRANLSNVASRSSFTLKDGHEYPGDSVAMAHAVAGDKVLVAWVSKYCEGGSPSYTLTDEEKIALDEFMGLEDGSLYLEDLFGVAGSQNSVDYTGQGFPEIGEVPFGCVWTARGSLEQDPETDLYDILWRKAERLTSGRRDPNRIEAAAADGAGFIIVWQEDPEGLRPGSGEGPGEGWSGAIVNAKTDIWYSYIGWDTFDWVADDAGTLMSLDDYLATNTTTPKVGVPMAMPVRVTDNNMCAGVPKLDEEGNEINPYCYEDYNDDGTAEFCANTFNWTNPKGVSQPICVTEDGRVLMGRVGASRPRIELHGYDSDGDGEHDSAWVVLGYEENKALGEGTSGTTGSDEEEAEPLDIGKNLWYHSFDMSHPDIVSHGNMLNQPSMDPETGDFFPIINTADAGLDLGAYNYNFYETEICRRFSLISQDIEAAAVSESRVVAFTLIKQGIINQGGPADIYARRIVMPGEGSFNLSLGNPYAFENMACEEWAFRGPNDELLNPGDADYNPHYPKGVCLDTPVNVSGTSVVTCDTIGDPLACIEAFPWDGGETYPKVTEWSQSEDNLDDQSWENPYDIAKGHRGFMDGDFIMVLYAWSPNYKANSVGNDHYNLYVRRSFDGGVTWTTTPAALGGDGTETCENYGQGSDVNTVCTTYAEGAFEPARNVSQLIGNRETILDPRYSPTMGSILTDGAFLYPDDERDHSKFFIVYETGDNTTVTLGEATPLDLFYSRAYNWGDDYDLVEYYNSKTNEIVEAFDWLEHGPDESGEAAILGNPGGTYFYAAWNQALEIGDEEFTDMDTWFRRTFHNDDGDSAPTASILFASATAVDPTDGTVTFVGSGKDNDQMGGGVDKFLWESSLDGELSTDKKVTLAVEDLSTGLHTISFKAGDAEGNWSSPKAVSLLVAEEITRIYLPTLLR